MRRDRPRLAADVVSVPLGSLAYFGGELLDYLFGTGLQITFPDRDDGPAVCLQRRPISSIPFDITIELVLPEFGSRGGCCGVPAAFMPMPETAVDKDRSVVFRQNDIGFSGKVFRMKPEPETGTVQQRVSPQGRCRVP